MKIQEMADALRRYEQEVAKTNIFRYTNTVDRVERYPNIFGMNFEVMMSTPDEKKAEVFLAQQRRADVMRRLMTGQTVGDDEVRESFGFSLAELEACRREQEPLKKPIPSNLCVLCFDDALKSQYDVALPVLKELGFNATFFITEMQETPRDRPFEDKSVYMTWEQIKEIEDAGFELGNHSLHHVFGSQNMGRDFNLEQIRGMEAEFEAHGLKKPVTYAYPSGISNPEVVACARACGYRWGRGNQEKGKEGIRGMTYYDPHQDSPLAICNFGDPDFYSEEFLRRRIADTPEGMIFGLTYHGVSDAEWLGPCSFRRQMEVLREMGTRVISMAQLEEFIDPEKAYQYTID
ncbi:MAG: polysaccharide deacetylase family protein [Oscillospiraceae bacterium]|nr:polysaccharide deacetylase family protein [Oscillospiraceae bacterium]